MSPPSFLILALVAAAICMVTSRSINFPYTEIENEIELSHDRNRNREDVSKNFKCPAMYGRYPHPKSCEYFFECRSGTANLKQCSRNNLYDEKKQQCLDKKRVHCHRGHKDSSSGSGSGSKEDKSSEEKDDGKEFKCPNIWGSYPDPRDCSKYYVCLYDVPTSYKCHKNELFDEKAKKCLDRKRVDCGKRGDKDGSKTTKIPRTTTKKIVTTTSIPTTTEVYDRFLCPFPNGRYADPRDCSKYYECHYSVPTLKQCRGSELYDERKEKCQHKKDVRCGNRGKDTEEDDLFCPYKWGTFDHPKDCSKYIVCIYNVPTVLSCNKNELFHSANRRCQPKKKVTCGNRENPDDLLPPEKTTEGLTSPIISTITTTEETTTSSIEEVTTPTENEVTTSDETTSSEETTTVEESTASEETTSQEEETTSSEETTPPEEITTVEETTAEEVTSAEETTPSEEVTVTEETTPSEEITTVEETTPSEDVSTTEETTPSEAISTAEEISSTTVTPTLPNTPPPTNCDEDDLDCILDETGDVTGWFACPDRYGHFPHGSSKKLFIHCDNFKPFVKTCADNTEFSPVYLVCTWPS